MRLSGALAAVGLAFSPGALRPVESRAPAVQFPAAAAGLAVYAPADGIPADFAVPAPQGRSNPAVGFFVGAGIVAVLAVAARPVRQARGSIAPDLLATRCTRAVAMMAADDAAPSAIATPDAYIEFIIGVPEPCVPDVSLTRSRDGTSGVATFTFDNPTFLQASSEALGDTTGMYLKDSEGTMKSTDVTATFTNGKPRIVKGVVVMKGEAEWDRFMRFMERYAESNDLGFSKA